MGLSGALGFEAATGTGRYHPWSLKSVFAILGGGAPKSGPEEKGRRCADSLHPAAPLQTVLRDINMFLGRAKHREVIGNKKSVTGRLGGKKIRSSFCRTDHTKTFPRPSLCVGIKILACKYPLNSLGAIRIGRVKNALTQVALPSAYR